MIRRVGARRAWARGALLVVCAIIAGSSLTGLLIVRAHVTASDRAHTHQTIVEVCRHLHRLDVALEDLVAASATRKALLQTSYYRTHPHELERAIERARDNARILRQADCSATEIGHTLTPQP